MTINECRDAIDIDKTIRILRGYLKTNKDRESVLTVPLSTGYGREEYDVRIPFDYVRGLVEKRIAHEINRLHEMGVDYTVDYDQRG
jgi:hypothetical protein